MTTRFVISALLFCIVVSSCGEPAYQSANNGPKSRSNKKSSTENVGQNSPSADANGENIGQSNKTSFKYGPKSTPNDLLFIFDNSSSMKTYLTNVKTGFEMLAAADWFGDTRLAVMTTLPGDPNNLNNVHAGVDKYTGIASEPGFLSLISSAAFEKYRLAGGQVGSYPDPLCTDEWFKPEATNANSKRCLSVALQNPHHGVGCEAGMTALSQILDKRTKLFRDGALAQVVFISDAQDPGCNDVSLKNNRPSAQALKDKITQKHKLAGLKFHGVLPVSGGGTTKETTEHGVFGYPYNNLIQAEKGILIDITASSDYSEFAKQIAQTSLPEPVFNLPVKASKIISVKAGAEAVAPEKIQLAADGKSIRILGLNPAAEIEIVVTFEP
ncbi:MAG: hypothetical protein RL189_2552 [Pseudomonadota bacterium]|jgi:hypothetical protein